MLLPWQAPGVWRVTHHLHLGSNHNLLPSSLTPTLIHTGISLRHAGQAQLGEGFPQPSRVYLWLQVYYQHNMSHHYTWVPDILFPSLYQPVRGVGLPVAEQVRVRLQGWGDLLQADKLISSIGRAKAWKDYTLVSVLSRMLLKWTM